MYKQAQPIITFLSSKKKWQTQNVRTREVNELYSIHYQLSEKQSVVHERELWDFVRIRSMNGLVGPDWYMMGHLKRVAASSSWNHCP